MIGRIALLIALLTATAGLSGLALGATRAPSACARGYVPCLPVKADLDCGQIPGARKPIRVTGADPYGLDADRNGLGCELSGEGSGRKSPWGLILRKPPNKEATSAKVGDILTVFGWSPASRKGEAFQLCVSRLDGVVCRDSNRYVLKGTMQRFDVWKVARGQRRNGGFKLSLRVKGDIRAFDTVPMR